MWQANPGDPSLSFIEIVALRSLHIPLTPFRTGDLDRINFKMPVTVHVDISRWNVSFVLRICLKLAGFGDNGLVEIMACRLLQVHQLRRQTCSGLLDLPRRTCLLCCLSRSVCTLCVTLKAICVDLLGRMIRTASGAYSASTRFEHSCPTRCHNPTD